ncbi:hypothetical protein GC207_07575 [bacterium]|nr:hypothetical protein [bacterium]
MKNVNLLFRRTHLYLGMLLIPWMFIYAFSTFLINHGPFFRQFRPGPDGWFTLWEENYDSPLPGNQSELRDWAGTILKQHNLYGQPFGVQKNQQRVLINAPRFIKAFRVTYRIKEHKLIAEQRETSWVETFLRLHFRAGYGQVSWMQKVWGFVVDLVCLSFLIWVVTGLYLWWKIPQTRTWGWLAIGAGVISFFGILLSL